jgi:signal transduction histidine kinase
VLDLGHYQSLVSDTIAELDEILTTFSSLLRISQIEAPDRTAAFRNIDLSEIVREVVELFEPAAEERAVRLELSAGEAVSMVGDRDLLFDAISNLVDNAIKHGGDHSDVWIAAAQGADGPVLSIADHGPGIPIDEHKHVLRRFYRLERSRNRPGNGLGLSLVAAVANLHGAHVIMSDNSPGLRIEVHFPVAQRAASNISDRQSSCGRLVSSYPNR